MLTQICQYLRNWFERDKYHGSFTVADGTITYADGTALPLIDNQYYRIVGSVMNDGVHKYGDSNEELYSETFTGSVWSMAVPKDVETLSSEISAWCDANTSAINSPYVTESFGGYSYTKGNSADGTSGATWQSHFAARLSPWRKI